MVNVTIQNSSGVTFTFEEGEINTVSPELIADLDHSPMPISGPMGSMLFDISGVTKVILVSGQLIESSSTRTSTGTTTTILQQKQWLESLMNGNQTRVTFTSNYELESYGSNEFKDTTVMVQRLNFTEESANPQQLMFSMNLLVGGI